MKFFIYITFAFLSSYASASVERVPYIFTGNSPAPEYQNYSKYRYKEDRRDSTGYQGYHLDYDLLNQVRQSEGVWAVHTMVRDISRDGLCDYSQCFRVYIFVNGDEEGGYHVATFTVSPGTGRRTPLYYDAKLRKHTRYLYRYEKPGQFKNYDMYRIYGSKAYPDPIPNMPNAMFFSASIALHGSFGRVDGNKRSHGCIRMFPDESYWLHSLVRESGGNLTVDVRHTR